MGATGLEHRENPSGKPHIPDEGVTESVTNGAEIAPEVADPDLAAVIAAWPDLPAALRAGIVAMIRSAGAGQ